MDDRTSFIWCLQDLMVVLTHAYTFFYAIVFHDLIDCILREQELVRGRRLVDLFAQMLNFVARG